MMKERRSYKSREELILMLPTGKWFNHVTVGVDMNRNSFNQKLKKYPEELLERDKSSGQWKFRLTKKNQVLLLAMDTINPGARKGVKKPRKGNRAYKLKLKDVCHNLFEGVTPTNQQWRDLLDTIIGSSGNPINNK